MEQDTYSVRVKPERTAKSLLEDLIKENSKQFNINQFRTISKKNCKMEKKTNKNSPRKKL